MSIISMPKLIRTIQQLQGSKGALSLGSKQLRQMAQNDKTLAQALSTLTEPTMDVAYKAKSNYNVAAFRLKDGKNTVANGAISLQNPGTTESVLKYRINVGENGAVARSNGFIDTGKKLDLDDVEVFGKRKNGVTSTNVTSGNAAGFAAEINEKQAIELAEQIQPGSGYGFVGKMKSNSKAGQMIENLNETWRELGDILSGKPKNPVDIVEGIADVKKLSPLQKNNELFLEEMAELKKQFKICTDKETKIKLGERFRDIERKYDFNLKHIDEFLKK